MTGISIIRSPAGIPVSGLHNTIYYPILSNVTLTCLVMDEIDTVTSYWWNTDCYTNSAYNDGNPSCFPHDKTTQNVTGTSLTAEDSGTISCVVNINGVNISSDPLTIRISGMLLIYDVVSMYM